MKRCLFPFFFALFFSVFLASAFAQTTSEEINPAAPLQAQSQELLRSNLQLQDQLHTALRAIEQSRKDAESAANKNAELFTERLNAVEKNLALQREHDLQSLVSMRQSNRFAMVSAIILAGVGLAALLLTVFFQVRAMNRIAEVGSLFSSQMQLDPSRALGNVALSANGNGALNAPTQLNSSEQSTSRFLAAVEQLEKRIHELDSTAAPSLKSDGSTDSPDTDLNLSPEATSLLLEGQTLLNNGQADKALACFEKAIELEPNSAEALIKKGTALEALRKMPEAIESYDRAIAADSSLTVAYLYKGGILNRQQRFSEAMECYEKALGTHPKKAA